MSETCRYCGETVIGMACRSTRDMEDRSNSKECFAALMFIGGGERSENQRLSAQLYSIHIPAAQRASKEGRAALNGESDG